MTWQQVICHTTAEHQDALSELMENTGSASVTLTDAADQPMLEPLPGETPIWDQLVLTALFPAKQDLTQLLLLLELQKQAGALHAIHVEKLEDRPWVREWMDQFHPMQFGSRLWIYPSWHEAPDDNSVKILLDPGLAFGTGTHPTTALCLEWLDSANLAGKSVLDYGCGSGILAIAAAKLGATDILATDIDPQALESTVNNAERNGLPADAIQTCYPEAVPTDKQYDIVIANILSGPLVKLADTLLTHLKPDGQLVLSGILAEQSKNIQSAYGSHLMHTETVHKEDWIRFSGIRDF